jgi:hypothetical protein
VVAMVTAIKEFAWTFLCVIFLDPAFGVTSLLGPTFFNGGSFEVDVYISNNAAENIQLLKDFPAKRFFAGRVPMEVNTMKVVSRGITFQTDSEEIAKQRQGLEPKEQLWLFDGERICVVKKRTFDAGVPFRCESGTRKTGQVVK